MYYYLCFIITAILDQIQAEIEREGGADLFEERVETMRLELLLGLRKVRSLANTIRILVPVVGTI